MRQIIFILPGYPQYPVGGYRAVYEIANRLCKKNIIIYIYYDYYFSTQKKLLDKIRVLKNYTQSKIRFLINKKSVLWFNLDKSISQCIFLNFQKIKYYEKGKYIATSWETAESLSNITTIPNKDKFYYIQHHEIYFPNVQEYRVINTWKFPFEKRIVTANWLIDIANNYNVPVVKVQYGVDDKDIFLFKPIETRNKNNLIMLYHQSPDKGSIYGIRAAELAKEKCPKIIFRVFGVNKRPNLLPDWIEYYQNPTRQQLNDLYNKSSIFLAPSIVEGWGMPGCEAAITGNALCMSTASGHLEYSFHQETALLSEPKDVKSMANNLITLINDNALRINIANNARNYVKKLTWDKCSNEFEKIIF